ncbi:MULTISPECIES: magnesium chelatase subunit D [Sphingomonas]|uniref:magnesium chelatase subunit D n=1 Tax=Sphingomonas TaxID=13687 RepID=UPI0006F2A7BB|nr:MULTISPECIES: magnesium chelatase subunit D [Sphingomonas]KQM90622.1 magnesium chelatase [Sphingomonas sp. Leaf226]MDY0968866.1 magnesium chelatase subunit D [Sphingomonas sp. CFBP9021]USR01696.1 magnesium chelatase subunit D [Sphingomonas aerolata]
MTGPAAGAPDPLADALIAARLCAADPGLGGIALRGGGALRDAVIAALRSHLPAGAPLRRVPVHVDDDRLFGGLDLVATLAQGRAVQRAGLLVEAAGGVLVLAMADRLSDAVAGRIVAAMDGGGVGRCLVVALDDGIGPDERPPAALLERLAFRIDLHDAKSVAAMQGGEDFGDAGTPPTSEAVLATLVATAAALGIETARAPLFALRAARAAARCAGRDVIGDGDLMLAARLVIAPRATRLPAEQPDDAPPPPEPQPPDAPPPDAGDRDQPEGETRPLDDVVLEAALAALPKDVLAQIAAGGVRRGRTRASRGAGERRRSPARGRPVGVRPGVPGGGQRLSLIDTLRAAAPWQRLRRTADSASRVLVRRDDLRIRRFETRAVSVTIFVVDASGSAALSRLAEAKGAVELLLADSYVQRAQVALIAFRGNGATVLLPPTRSLARARRSLAELPGGGGTPLAAGLRAAIDVADAARARGQTPFVVLLTDGRANIAADGRAVRSVAAADASAAATALGRAGIAAAFLDISARPGPEGAALAAAMQARYLPLPRADAVRMHAAVRAVQPA